MPRDVAELSRDLDAMKRTVAKHNMYFAVAIGIGTILFGGGAMLTKYVAGLATEAGDISRDVDEAKKGLVAEGGRIKDSLGTQAQEAVADAMEQGRPLLERLDGGKSCMFWVESPQGGRVAELGVKALHSCKVLIIATVQPNGPSWCAVRLSWKVGIHFVLFLAKWDNWSDERGCACLLSS